MGGPEGDPGEVPGDTAGASSRWNWRYPGKVRGDLGGPGREGPGEGVLGAP